MTAPQLGPSVSRLSTGDAFRLLKRRSPSVDLEMEGTAAATTGAAATGVWMTVSYEAKAGKRAGGRGAGATGAGGAPATATLLRPASAARPPQPTLLLEQAGNRERESALTRFTTCTATAARLRQCANVAKQTHSKTPELVWAHGFYFNVIRACEENLALIFLANF